tara:strand:+ start:211 stop:411 length:201 start_codon:yes stop_codon:yes gene_type:complete
MYKKNKDSKYKKMHDEFGQYLMFGYDNLKFKTINLPQKQRFKNLCYNFGLKKILFKNKIKINVIKL